MNTLPTLYGIYKNKTPSFNYANGRDRSFRHIRQNVTFLPSFINHFRLRSKVGEEGFKQSILGDHFRPGNLYCVWRESKKLAGLFRWKRGKDRRGYFLTRVISGRELPLCLYSSDPIYSPFNFHISCLIPVYSRGSNPLFYFLWESGSVSFSKPLLYFHKPLWRLTADLR